MHFLRVPVVARSMVPAAAQSAATLVSTKGVGGPELAAAGQPSWTAASNLIGPLVMTTEKSSQGVSGVGSNRTARSEAKFLLSVISRTALTSTERRMEPAGRGGMGRLSAPKVPKAPPGISVPAPKSMTRVVVGGGPVVGVAPVVGATGRLGPAGLFLKSGPIPGM